MPTLLALKFRRFLNAVCLAAILALVAVSAAGLIGKRANLRLDIRAFIRIDALEQGQCDAGQGLVAAQKTDVAHDLCHQFGT